MGKPPFGGGRRFGNVSGARARGGGREGAGRVARDAHAGIRGGGCAARGRGAENILGLRTSLCAMALGGLRVTRIVRV